MRAQNHMCIFGQDISHTLDLCGASLATGLVAQGEGDVTTATAMLRLTGNFVNVYDSSTGLLSNTKDDQYYEGTYGGYRTCVHVSSGQTQAVNCCF